MATTIVIRKKHGATVPAVLITFDTHSERFDSNYERNLFFKELHGWKQIIVKRNNVGKEQKRYEYPRNGILNEVPHMKVADSAFIVAMDNMKRMMEFFEQWTPKVEWDAMEIGLPQEKVNQIKGMDIKKQKVKIDGD
ncbi:MAG: hypothetical protein ABIG30_03060 [Candidatus Aenigmatarchaeota archaeon]